MTYELKDYLKAINKTKEKLMDTDDKMWEKKYPPFIVNKCVAPFPDTIHLVNRYTPWLKAKKIKNIEYVKEYYGCSNEKAKAALDVLNDEQIKTIKDSLSKGGNNGK